MKNSFFLIFSFFLFVTQAQANTESLCQVKVLDEGAITGVFSDIITTDLDYLQITLDNGEVFSVICGEDDVTALNIKKGSRVSINYELVQFWNFGNCMRFEVCKTPSPPLTLKK